MMNKEMLRQLAGYQKLHGFIVNFLEFRQGYAGDELLEFDNKHIAQLLSLMRRLEEEYQIPGLDLFPDQDK